MEASEVKTESDFLDFVKILSKTTAKTYEGSLEEYLRALWVVIQDNKGHEVTYTLLAKLLEDAFKTQPLPFQEDWLKYTAFPKGVGGNLETIKDKFGFMRDILLFQIADLHKMKANGTLDKSPELLWLGINSPTGHSWYNLHPSSFLNSARRGIVDSLEPGTSSYNEICDWGDFSIFLWLGQNYE